MSTKNVHQKNRPVSLVLLFLLQGIKQCIWATVNFLDISTTLQLVIMHDLCEVHPSSPTNIMYLFWYVWKKRRFIFPSVDACQEIVNFKNIEDWRGIDFEPGITVNSIQIEDILLYICIIKLLWCNEMLYKMVVVAVC